MLSGILNLIIAPPLFSDIAKHVIKEYRAMHADIMKRVCRTFEQVCYPFFHPFPINSDIDHTEKHESLAKLSLNYMISKLYQYYRQYFFIVQLPCNEHTLD